MPLTRTKVTYVDGGHTPLLSGMHGSGFPPSGAEGPGLGGFCGPPTCTFTLPAPASAGIQAALTIKHAVHKHKNINLTLAFCMVICSSQIHPHLHRSSGYEFPKGPRIPNNFLTSVLISKVRTNCP